MSATENQSGRITKDAFFYSCQQAFEARSRKDGFDSFLRFEPFLLKNYELPKNPTVKSFTQELTNVFKHQFQKTAQLKNNESLNIHNSAWFAQAIATLLADVGELLKNYTGQSVPTIPTEPVEFSDARPTLTAAIAKYSKKNSAESEQATAADAFQLFPLEMGTEEDAVPAAQQPYVFAAEIWDLIVSNVETIFSSDHAQLILEFFDWNFKPTQKLDKKIDWRVRPPVGELFFRYQKAMGFIKERPRFGDKKDKDSRFDKKRDSKDSREPRENREAREPREPRENREAREPREPREPRHEKGDDRQPKRYTREDAAAHRRERPQRERPVRVEFEDNKQALEHLRQKAIEQNCVEAFDAALDEVKGVQSKFKADASLQSMPLAPQNPFIRRAQHSLAVELGFETESTGEGRDRCVCLKRKN